MKTKYYTDTTLKNTLNQGVAEFQIWKLLIQGTECMTESSQCETKEPEEREAEKSIQAGVGGGLVFSSGSSGCFWITVERECIHYTPENCLQSS